MGSKRSQTADTNPSTKADNFKLIRGVNATVAARLHQAGILTFAQLASLSPEDIITLAGNLPGVTVDRIARQNWTGQARELALSLESGESPEDKTPPDSGDNGEHYATFVTEMLLDAGANLIHTRVRHVQTGDEEIWGGWKEDRFVKFFTEHAGLRRAETPEKQEAGKPEAASAAASSEPLSPDRIEVEAPANEITAKPIRDAEKTRTTAKPSPASPVATAIGTASATKVSTETAIKPRASKLEIVAAGSDLPSMLLRHDQAFNVRVSLDLSEVAGRREEPLAYTAIVHARSLSGKRAQSFSRTSGRITLSESAVINLSGISLGPGSYRLGADVTIHQPGQRAPLTPDFHIQTEAALIQVY